jgi:hypothetical protein
MRLPGISFRPTTAPSVRGARATCKGMSKESEQPDYTDKNMPRSRLSMWLMAIGGAAGLIVMWLLDW